MSESPKYLTLSLNATLKTNVTVFATIPCETKVAHRRTRRSLHSCQVEVVVGIDANRRTLSTAFDLAGGVLTE